MFAVANYTATASFAVISAASFASQTVSIIDVIQTTVSEIFSVVLSPSFASAASVTITLYDSSSGQLSVSPLILPVLTFSHYTQASALIVGAQFGIFANASGTQPTVVVQG